MLSAEQDDFLRFLQQHSLSEIDNYNFLQQQVKKEIQVGAWCVIEIKCTGQTYKSAKCKKDYGTGNKNHTCEGKYFLCIMMMVDGWRLCQCV